MKRSFIEGLNEGRRTSDIGWRSRQAGLLYAEKVEQQEALKGRKLREQAASLAGFAIGMLERDLVHAAIRTLSR